MQRKLSENGRARAERPGGIARGEWIRLGIMFVLALGVTTTILASLGDKGTQAAERPVWEPEEYKGPPAKVEVVVTPWEPPTAEINRILRETTQEDRVRSYPKALNLLAHAVASRSHVSFKHDPKWEAQGGFEAIPPERLANIDLSDSLRGQPIEVVGTVVTMAIVNAEEELGLEGTAARMIPTGLVRCGKTLVSFYLFDDGASESGPDQRVHLPAFAGQKVRVQGVFYRVKDIRRKGQDSYTTVPVILAKKVAPVIPFELRDDPPDPESFRDTASAEDVGVGLLREEAFYHLLGYVLKKGKEVVAATKPLSMMGKDPLEHPERYRLKPVKLKGVVLYTHHHDFEYEEMRPEDTPGGLTSCWHIIVAQREPEHNVPVNVIVPSATLPDTLKKGSAVELTGIYYRVHAHRNAKGVMMRMPLIIEVGEPKKLVMSEPFSLARYLWVFLAVGITLALALIYFVSKDRRGGVELDQKLRKIRGERRRGMNLDREASRLLKDPRDKPGD